MGFGLSAKSNNVFTVFSLFSEVYIYQLIVNWFNQIWKESLVASLAQIAYHSKVSRSLKIITDELFAL